MKLSKPNFQKMTMPELRRYVLANRDDNEAWDEYASRERPNALAIPAEASPSEIGRILSELANQERKNNIE